MILSGREIISQGLIRNIQNLTHQQQSCDIDLTLRQISRWTSAVTLDFDNTKRQAAKISTLPFDTKNNTVTLKQGAYLVDFNETIKTPKNALAQIFPHSTLW